MTSMAVTQSPAEPTDETLATAARGGDRTAFALLVARYRAVAVAYAYARLRDRDAAEDVVQEAFVRAFQGLPQFRAGASWGAWLMCILRNLCTDTVRRRNGRASEPLDGDWPDSRPTPEGQTLSREEHRALCAAVEKLPEKFRVPLLMYYVSGRTYREIAVALALPESTVIGRMAGAMRQLRRRMGREV